MLLSRVRTVLIRRLPAGRFALIAVFWLLVTAPHALAQTFSGPYAGVDAGWQHLIGGSLVDNVDTLQEDGRFVVSVFGGLRAQVRGFVLGGELGVGRVDGDLYLAEPARELTVDYRNNSQWHWAFTGGYAVRSNTLIFAYLSEVTRHFDVTVTRSGQSTVQRDEQGLLRFGAGVEQRLSGPWHLRIGAGSSRADFGNRATNVSIDRQFEFSAGLVLQF